MRATEIFPVQEAMIWNTPTLAAFLPKEGSIILYYETDELKTAIEEYDYTSIQKEIVGSINVIELGKANNITYNHVARVWAEKGFGPLLYYTAMAKYGWLSPSRTRGSISEQAKKVWKKFSQMSNMKSMDVKAEHDDDYLRKAYMLDNITKNKAGQALNGLLYKHRQFMKEVSDQREAEELIWEMADKIAGTKMTELE